MDEIAAVVLFCFDEERVAGTDGPRGVGNFVDVEGGHFVGF